MFKKLRPHLTYANVVSSICLFVLLGGSAYAATRIGSRQIVNNSIRSKDIRNGNVTSRDIKNNDVRSGDVRNGSLLAGDFAPGQLPRGAQGPQGPRGATGAAGVSGYQIVQKNERTTGARISTSLPCPTGKRVVGGGYEVRLVSGGVSNYRPADGVIDDGPSNDGRSWLVDVTWDAAAPAGFQWSVTVRATCINAL